MALLCHSLPMIARRYLARLLSSRERIDRRLVAARQNRAREKFAILVLVEPRAFKIE
jgi:hypothetical protein